MKRPRMWPGVIFALLALNACVVAATLVVAHLGPALAVEPDYYRQALEWDRTRERQQRSERLGWRPDVHLGEARSGTRPVTLRVQDRNARPVEGARARLIAFASRNAVQRHHVPLSEEQPGVYVGVIPDDEGGLWEFRISCERGEEVFTASLEQMCPGGGS